MIKKNVGTLFGGCTNLFEEHNKYVIIIKTLSDLDVFVKMELGSQSLLRHFDSEKCDKKAHFLSSIIKLKCETS